VRALGLEGRFSFVDPGRRVPELLPALDVFAMSSVPRSEGVPTVIFEAMSTGLPVVTTDVGAVREFVEEDVTGYVVPPLQDARLADALAPLVADAGLRARLGETARARVLERYHVDRCADVYADAFERALAHRAGRR
jgi:glycosyltransferase involved in cell wall biosynthesis